MDWLVFTGVTWRPIGKIKSDDFQRFYSLLEEIYSNPDRDRAEVFIVSHNSDSKSQLIAVGNLAGLVCVKSSEFTIKISPME